MKLYYQIDHLDKDCRIKKRYKKRRSRSFIKSFLTLMYTKVSALSTTLVDYLNASQTESGTSNYLTYHCLGINGESIVKTIYNYTTSQEITWVKSHLLGVVIGTGTNAVTSTDYALQTKIDTGVGAGQIEYSSTGFSAVTVSAPNASFTIDRIFRNGSSGSITVREIGLYAICHQNIYCHIRDVLGVGAVAMAVGDYLKVTYTLTITA